MFIENKGSIINDTNATLKSMVKFDYFLVAFFFSSSGQTQCPSDTFLARFTYKSSTPLVHMPNQLIYLSLIA